MMTRGEYTGTEKRKNTLRRIIRPIHLWLGLTSGLIVFIIAVTGCMYAFQVEIKDLTQSFRHVEPQKRAFLAPSRIREIADARLPGKHPHAVLYGEKDKAAQVIYYSGLQNYYYLVFLNPYTGEVLKVKNMNSDFFNLVLKGHFYLWLPPKIGQPVAGTATLIFVVMLIPGIVLWWPRNKKGVKQRLSIKWTARWRRKNYDLHSVLGFYVSWFAIILALTGLVWGFKWFADGVYRIASGGKEYKKYQEPLSDTANTMAYHNQLPAVDRVWLKVSTEHATAEAIEVHYPESSGSSILATINSDDFTYWKRDFRFFDQYSLKELSVDHTWGRLKDASGADKLMRMNYDIHVGAILGLPGKFIAFVASLLVASLPVTGVMMWIGRRNKKKESPALVTQRVESIPQLV